MNASNSVLVSIGLIVLAGTVTGQRTWIVDRQNRPGADFTDIQPAVNAAAPGDILELRYVDNAATGLFYEATTIDGKGITIRGDPVQRPPVLGLFRITNLPAGQRTVLANLAHGDRLYDNGFRSLPQRGILGLYCQGEVRLENLLAGARNGDPAAATRWNGGAQPPPANFYECALVTIANCELHQSWAPACVGAYRTKLAATNSLFGGGVPDNFYTWFATLSITNEAEVWLTDCAVLGTNGWSYPPLGLWNNGTPAVNLCTETLHLSGRCTLVGAQGLGGRAAIERDTSTCNLYPGIGHIDADSRTTLVGGIGWGLTYSFSHVAGITWTLDRQGGTLTTRQYSEPGSAVLYAASLPMPTPVRLSAGLLFLDPSTLNVLSVMAGNAIGEHDLVLPVSPLPAVGVSVAMQGAQLSPSGELRLTHVVTPGNY